MIVQRNKMIYIVLPHENHTWADMHVFTSFSAAEQCVLRSATILADAGHDFNWCTMVAYEGQDELVPIFLYRIVSPKQLRREPYPTPSP